MQEPRVVADQDTSPDRVVVNHHTKTDATPQVLVF